MPSETLDTLYISFKESGASKIFATIRAIDSELSKLERKMEKSETQVLSRLSKTREAFDKKVVAAQREFGQAATANKQHLNDELGILRQIATVSKEIKNNIGTNAKIDARTTINETGSHVNTRTITNYKYGKGSSPFYDVLFNVGTGKTNSDDKTKDAIVKTAENTTHIAKQTKNTEITTLKFLGALIAFGKSVQAFHQNTISQQEKVAQWDTAKSLAGLSGNAAENAFANLAQFGGGRMDAISSDRNISTSLGRLAYGDTSLIQSLGMFGIGGISPRSNPQEIRQKVIDRLKRGDMGINQVNALFSALPYSDAEKMAILNNIDIYKGNAKPINLKKIGKEQLKQNALGDNAIQSATQSINESLFGRLLTGIGNFIKEELPYIPAIWEKVPSGLSSGISGFLLAKYGKNLLNLIKGGGAASAASGSNLIPVSALGGGGLLSTLSAGGATTVGAGFAASPFSVILGGALAATAGVLAGKDLGERLGFDKWGEKMMYNFEEWRHNDINSTNNSINNSNNTTNNYYFNQNESIQSDGNFLTNSILNGFGGF